MWLDETADGRAWLASVPRIVADCAERWGLTIGEAFAYASSSLVLRATRADGTPAALKIAWPHREATHEAAALQAWDGDGAVRLLEHDPERSAMLLERAMPGTPLKELAQDDAIDAMRDLLRRLWRPAGAPFTPLAEEAAWWKDYLPRVWALTSQPFERRLLDAAVEVLDELPRTQGRRSSSTRIFTPTTCSVQSVSRGSRSTRNRSSPSVSSRSRRLSAATSSAVVSDGSDIAWTA